ncbi:MAG: DUF5615 family PIN-like protein [Dehalococcoidia bacterium]|nr:DUF5615 family PIN-like protein [Dehalococcoidia bacterium]
MGEPITFYLDEHVHSAIAYGLRRRGLDVITAKDAGLLGARDEQHLAFAIRNGRVILTQDADFLRLHAYGHQHCGIVYAPQNTTIGAIIQGLVLLYGVLGQEDMADNVEFI